MAFEPWNCPISIYINSQFCKNCLSYNGYSGKDFLLYCRKILNIFASFYVSHLSTWLIAMFDSRLSRTVSEVPLPRSSRSFHETTPYWRTKSDMEGEMEEDGEKLASTSAGTSSSPYRTIEWRWGKESRMLRTLTRETRKNKNWLLKASSKPKNGDINFICTGFKLQSPKKNR